MRWGVKEGGREGDKETQRGKKKKKKNSQIQNLGDCCSEVYSSDFLFVLRYIQGNSQVTDC